MANIEGKQFVDPVAQYFYDKQSDKNRFKQPGRGWYKCGDDLAMIGRRFGRLTVIKKAPSATNNGDARWYCQCDCGNQTIVRGYCLRIGKTKSCGCIKKGQKFEQQLKKQKKG